MFNNSVCHSCAVEEIKKEYLKRGIPVTPSARKFYTQQLSRLKSVEDVIEVLWEPISATIGQKGTLFDTVPADKNANPVNFNQFVKKNNYFLFLKPPKCLNLAMTLFLKQYFIKTNQFEFPPSYCS